MAGEFQRGLKTQIRCIGALIIRDVMSHYGRANIGFLWIVLEPLILATGVMTIWHSIKPSFEHGVPILRMAFTCYLPLTLWRHLTNSCVGLLSHSHGLLYHRRITLVDIVISRLALEAMGTTTALVFAYLVLAAADLIELPTDPSWAVAGWISMIVLASGMGFVLAILSEYSEATQRFVQPMQYLMLPLSGAFFMVDWLPTSTQSIALLNPTVHCYEMFRAGVLGDGVVTHFTPWYPALCGLVLFAIGLYGLDSLRSKLHTN